MHKQREVILVVCRAVADVVHEHIGDWTTVLAALAQPFVESIPYPHKLLASRSGVIEEVEDKLPVEPEAGAVVEILDHAGGRAPE